MLLRDKGVQRKCHWRWGGARSRVRWPNRLTRVVAFIASPSLPCLPCLSQFAHPDITLFKTITLVSLASSAHHNLISYATPQNAPGQQPPARGYRVCPPTPHHPWRINANPCAEIGLMKSRQHRPGRATSPPPSPKPVLNRCRPRPPPLGSPPRGPSAV